MGHRTRALLLGLLGVLALGWVAVGPRPADNTPYRQTDYYRETMIELSQASPLRARGVLQVGVAEADITPPAGHPLAGYGGRRPKAATGVDTPCRARALTLSVGGQAVTLLGGDYLLPTGDLAEAVRRAAGLEPNQIYFTASHTHSGPGGYAEGPIYELVFGDYDPAYFQELVEHFADLVKRSRAGLQPAEFARVSRDLPGRQQNRIDPASPTHDPFSLLLFRPAGQPTAKPLALLAVFGAHATVLGTDNRLASADYPGHLADRLQELTGAGTVLFAAGSVGDARPHGVQENDPYRRAKRYGVGLAEALAPALGDLRWRGELELASLNLRVRMPEVRVPLGTDWTLGPLVTRLVADREGRLSALRIDDLLLNGFPADYSGHLAHVLAEQVRALSQTPLISVATSFSGAYKGYLVSSDWYFRKAGYETREVNFFGPWAGEYLNEIAVEMDRRLL